jgi:drug/metabolite transporter (DMT)-like permease
MEFSQKSRAAGMLVFTTVAWGAMFSIAKHALGALDAFWLTALRYGFAGAVMLVVLRVAEGRGALSLDGRGVELWLLGSLGFAGFSILAFLGIAQSRPEHAAIIVALTPLVTALMNWMLRGQRPRGVTLASALVALIGAALVITKGHWRSAAEGTLQADALVLAGVVCWIGYTMGAARFSDRSPMRYTALSMALGVPSIVAIAMATWALGFTSPPTWDVVATMPFELAYLSLVGGVLAVLAWNGGIAVLGPASGVLFINLVPITAFAIGVAQGQRFRPVEIVGAMLVIGALVVNSLASRPAPVGRLASASKFA